MSAPARSGPATARPTPRGARPASPRRPSWLALSDLKFQISNAAAPAAPAAPARAAAA